MYNRKSQLSKWTTLIRIRISNVYADIFSFLLRFLLRTVPTIVNAHTFCASRDTRDSYRWCLLIQEYFCAVYNYTEKAELTNFFWYLKRKLGVAMLFSEIIRLQFRKKSHTLLYILAVFRDTNV